MPDETMSSQENGGPKPRLIINARGDVKDVSVPVSGAPVLPQVPRSVEDKAVAAVSGAIGGAVVERFFDAIQDERDRLLVQRKVEASDKKYDDDPFKDLTYGELRKVLTTRKHEGRPLDDDRLAEARHSRELRFEEASRYGVMTGVEQLLKTKLIEADWHNYPAAIAEAAQTAEREARAVSAYANNSRIEGVVSDAVGATDLMARRDGLRQISDVNNPRNQAKLRELKITDVNRELAQLDQEIADNVLWDPMRNYAAVIDQETPEQRAQRADDLRHAQDQAHERALRQQELEVARELADRNANAAQDAGRINLTITREHAVGGDTTIFDDDFVRTHGLPVEIFSRPIEVGATKVQGIKTATLLGQVFSSGTVMPEFSWENIRYTIEGDYQHDPVGRERALRNAFKAFNELQNGIFPLMMARWSTKEGSLFSLGGRDLQGGVLNKGKGTIDMSEVIPAFAKDEKAKRALAILLAADGYWVQGMPLSDKSLADDFAPKFKDILVNAEYDKGWSKVRKTAGYTQSDCVDYLDREVAGRIASHLGCDLGRVDLMVMLYTALGGAQRVIDYRELYQRFPVLRTADPRKYNAEKKKWEGDVFMSPLLHKLKLGNDREDRHGEPLGEDDLGFGYVERQLATKGINGLFEALTTKPGLRDGHDVGKYVAGLDVVFSAMKKVEDIQKGDDSFTSAIERRKKIAELVDGFAQGDPPQFSPKTLEAIKNLPVYSGVGKLAEAGNRPADLVAQDVDMIVDKLGLRGVVRGIQAGAGWLRKKIRS